MSIVSEIREALDEASGAVFWSPEQIYTAANEAIVDVFSTTRHEYATATITLTASAFGVALPSTIMIPQVIIGTSSACYFPTTKAKLEQYCRTWRSTSASYPKHFVLRDVETLDVYPKPDAAYTFVVAGVPWPTVTELADGHEDITLPSVVRSAIVCRAVSELLEYTQPTLSQQFLSDAKSHEHEFIVSLRNRQSHNIRRLRPGTLFTRAQSGSVELGRKYS